MGWNGQRYGIRVQRVEPEKLSAVCAHFKIQFNLIGQVIVTGHEHLTCRFVALQREEGAEIVCTQRIEVISRPADRIQRIGCFTAWIRVTVGGA